MSTSVHLRTAIREALQKKRLQAACRGSIQNPEGGMPCYKMAHTLLGEQLQLGDDSLEEKAHSLLRSLHALADSATITRAATQLQKLLVWNDPGARALRLSYF
jgi:hypothetical protein